MLESRKKYKRKYYGRTATFTKKRWSMEEDCMVLDHDIVDTELAKKINRSVMAIQIRRSRLAKEVKKNDN